MKYLTVIMTMLVGAHLAIGEVIQAALDEQADGLRLDVSCELEAIVGVNKAPLRHALIIRSALTNVGRGAITVPSNSYDGGPSSWVTSSSLYGISFSVVPRTMQERVITPSPLRFFPVVLQPGETTELPVYRATIGDPELLEKVSVEFIVDEAFAKKFKWWFGELRKDIKVTLKNKPREPAKP